MSKRPKNLDLNQLAKRIVDEAIGEIQPEEIDEKKKAAIESGRLLRHYPAEPGVYLLLIRKPE